MNKSNDEVKLYLSEELKIDYNLIEDNSIVIDLIKISNSHEDFKRDFAFYFVKEFGLESQWLNKRVKMENFMDILLFPYNYIKNLDRVDLYIRENDTVLDLKNMVKDGKWFE